MLYFVRNCYYCATFVNDLTWNQHWEHGSFLEKGCIFRFDLTRCVGPIADFVGSTPLLYRTSITSPRETSLLTVWYISLEEDHFTATQLRVGPTSLKRGVTSIYSCKDISFASKSLLPPTRSKFRTLERHKFDSLSWIFLMLVTLYVGFLVGPKCRLANKLLEVIFLSPLFSLQNFVRTYGQAIKP